MLVLVAIDAITTHKALANLPMDESWKSELEHSRRERGKWTFCQAGDARQNSVSLELVLLHLNTQDN